MRKRFLIILAIVLIILLSGKKKYTITFDTAGGDKIDSVVVEKGNTVPEPVKPTKEGYIFDGWTGSNGDIPEKDITISKGTIGNLEYTANWSENKKLISIIPVVTRFNQII